MNEIQFEQWAKGIASKSNFIIDERIHMGLHYTKEHVRTMVFSGMYAYETAILKVYDDPRGCDEPSAIAQYALHNTSEQIKTPEILASHSIDAHRGWFISKTNKNIHHPFMSPMTVEQRSQFLNVFVEYRTHLPTEPIRQLQLSEYLPAHEFHTVRLGKWFTLAMKAERLRATPILDPSELIPRYTRVVDQIRDVFSQRKMIWCHGHFKPDSILLDSQAQTYSLIDLDHAGMYPEGYELAFMVWADVLMDGDYNVEYTLWRARIDGWLDDLHTIGQTLDIADFDTLIHASLLERLIGTILADVAASDMGRDDMVGRLNYLHRLYDQII